MTTELRREALALAGLCFAAVGLLCGVTVMASAHGDGAAPTGTAPTAHPAPSTGPVSGLRCPPGKPGQFYLGRFPCPETKGSAPPVGR